MGRKRKRLEAAPDPACNSPHASPHYTVISSVCATVVTLRRLCELLGLPVVPAVRPPGPSDPPGAKRARGLRQLLVRVLDSTIVGIPFSDSAAEILARSKSSSSSSTPSPPSPLSSSILLPSASSSRIKSDAFRRAVFGSAKHEDPSLFERQQYLRHLVPRAIFNILRREQQQGVSWKNRNILSRGY